MDEKKQENSIEKTIIKDQIEDNNLLDNQSSKTKKTIHKKIIQFQMFEYLKQTYNSLKTKYNLFCSNFLLVTQFLIFVVFFSLFLFFSIFLLHYFGFERIFKFDYFFAVQNEYLEYLISDFDDINLNLGSYEVQSQFEDVDNIYFFNIYFKEMISMGLLNDESHKKVFPNISSDSSKIYQNLDKYMSENKIDSFYTISNEQTKKYIDDREDNLSEIAKLYYQFLPILAYSGYLKDTYINQSYLIAYEYDNETKNIIGKHLYFSFPMINGMFNLSNFAPQNSLISPSIRNGKVEHREKYNDTYYKENWFIKQDYDFRSFADDINCYFLSFSNLIYNHYGILNKSNLISMQNYFNSNNKSYIINIIYFIGQKIIKDEYLDFSVFVFINDSAHPHAQEKYSDNDTFLISKLGMTEIALSSSLKEYFHYGMIDKNYNFYKHGVSFDIIDMQSLAEPLKYYISNEKFNIDLRYFSSLYLYTSLYRFLDYNITKEEIKPLTEIFFFNKENKLQNICSIIDFNSYITYLKEEKINCFDENNLLYYVEGETKENIFHFNYNTMPYCICLPLYCLKNLQNKFDINKTEFIDEIILPDKCQNDYKTYLNGINEIYNNKSIKIFSFLEFNYGLNDITFLSKNIRDSIEDEYYIFKSLKFPQLPNLTFSIFALVDNYPFKEVVCNLIAKIDKIKSFYIIIELSGMILAFIIGNIIIIRNIKKISNAIFDYEKIYNKLYKSESLSMNDSSCNRKNENAIFNSINEFEKISYGENLDLNNNEKNINIYNADMYNFKENSFLNELMLLYCKYYNTSKEVLIKKYYNSKHTNNNKNQNQIEEENELFILLRIMSIYIPKFKLNVSMDYNFYLNSELYCNYIKSITKDHHIKSTELTQSVIFELLSTECTHDNYGLITNINFKYITNININSKIDNNSIKNSMFSFADNEMKLFKQKIFEKKYILIEDENINDNIKIIWKEKNVVLEEFEANFENDDYLKKEKLREVFDSFLVNTYYKYLKKILSNTSQGY